MSDSEECQHVYRWSYSDVRASAHSGDRNGYIVDVLHCERCGKELKKDAGAMHYLDARDAVERRNRNR